MILFPLLSSVRENGEISLIVGRLALLCKTDSGKKITINTSVPLHSERAALEKKSLSSKHFKAEALFCVPSELDVVSTLKYFAHKYSQIPGCDNSNL